MQEQELRQLIEDVRNGALPRRSFIQQMVGLGLTAPMASMMLMHAGVAQAQAPPTSPPSAVVAGCCKLLFWQGPTLLNPHFARAPRTRKPRASSTSRWPCGTPTAT
jgi:peptide/nickel transport system substrate-binding protein